MDTTRAAPQRGGYNLWRILGQETYCYSRRPNFSTSESVLHSRMSIAHEWRSGVENPLTVSNSEMLMMRSLCPSSKARILLLMFAQQ